MSKKTSQIYHLDESELVESAGTDRFEILEEGAEDSPAMTGKDAPVTKMTHEDHTRGNIATQVEWSGEDEEQDDRNNDDDKSS